LHGYDESSESFEFLAEELPAFSILAIDLPFHGRTEWNEGLDFALDDVDEIIQKIKQEHFPGIQKFSFLGFSMGGRIALGMLEKRPSEIEKAVLLAPDGIRMNFWYWLATQTSAGNRLFRFSVANPAWILGTLKLGNKLGIINQSVYKFTGYYLHDKGNRQKLYTRWTGMRKIKPDISNIKQTIKSGGLSVSLVYGEYDRIIRHERGKKLRDGIEAHCSLHIIPTGHQVLQKKNVSIIVELVNSQ
jgi:pimeloyl-ACP methyl ester carboxylesterase